MKKKLLLAAGAMMSLALNAQTIYTENFETGNADLISGDNFSPFVSISSNACGEAEVRDLNRLDSLPLPFSPMVVTFRDETGSSTLIDISANQKVTVGIRAAAGLQIRMNYVSPVVVDGELTPRLRDNNRQTVKTDYELEELVFDFTSTTPRASWDPTNAERLFIEVDPITSRPGAEFTGGIFYIDYIVIGDVDPTLITPTTCSGTDDTQFIFGNGSSFYVNDFTDPSITSFSGMNLNHLVLDTVAECGKVVLTDRDDTVGIGGTAPILFSTRDANGSTQDIDMTGNTKVVVRAKAIGGDANIRVDLRSTGTDNSTNGGQARIMKTFPQGVWTTAEYIFFPGQLRDIDGGEVDITSVNGINMSFGKDDGGIGADSIIFDFVSFGEGPIDSDIACVNAVNRRTAIQTLGFYPNPVSGSITVEAASQGNLTIVNQYGALVQESKVNSSSQTISLEGLESGLYIIMLTTDEGQVFTNNFVKD